MKTKSINELKKHVRFCGKCHAASRTNKLCKIIRDYATQDYVRQKEISIRPQLLEKAENNDWAQYLSPTSDRATQESIQDLLKVLDPIDHEIITLRFWEGKTFREIAQLLHYSSPAPIHDRLKRAIKLLKTYLTSENSKKQEYPEVTLKKEQITITVGGNNYETASHR